MGLTSGPLTNLQAAIRWECKVTEKTRPGAPQLLSDVMLQGAQRLAAWRL